LLLEAPVYKELFGAVEIFEVLKVIKLDSQTKEVGSLTVKNVPSEDIYRTLEDMAVVVPMKDEKLQLVDGVLKAIPHQCPIIIVSNSKREGPNVFKREVDLVKHFYSLTKSRIVVVHQRDPGIGEAFREIGYTEILEGENVRGGKGEGMIIGVLLAKALGVKYVSFVDADNYIPGSVNEYVKDYAAGFLMSESDYSMVRLSWRHKPKVSTRGLYFRKWGRVSEITNRYMNALFGVATGFETSIIVTGNAGEHAMSMKLADVMPFSTGYSIEPYELVYLFETFGQWKEREKFRDVYEQGVEVFQIETLNPHLHEDKGQEHVRDMIISSLGAIYHSELATESLRKAILEDLRIHSLLGENEEPPRPKVMPPTGGIDAGKWMKIVENESDTLLKFEV